MKTEREGKTRMQERHKAARHRTWWHWCEGWGKRHEMISWCWSGLNWRITRPFEGPRQLAGGVGVAVMVYKYILVFMVAVYVKFSNIFYIIFFLTVIPAIYTNGLIPVTSSKRNGEWEFKQLARRRARKLRPFVLDLSTLPGTCLCVLGEKRGFIMSIPFHSPMTPAHVSLYYT